MPNPAATAWAAMWSGIPDAMRSSRINSAASSAVRQPMHALICAATAQASDLVRG